MIYMLAYFLDWLSNKKAAILCVVLAFTCIALAVPLLFTTQCMGDNIIPSLFVTAKVADDSSNDRFFRCLSLSKSNASALSPEQITACDKSSRTN